MDVFHSNLESIEAAGFRDLHLSAELFRQIFKDDAIACRKESKDILDEMFLFLVQLVPISQILVEINLVGGPEGCQMFFVHFEDRVIFDGKQDESLFV